MRQEERLKFVRRVNTVGEASISNHKPKKMVLELRQKKWRKANRKRVPWVKWEALKDEEVARRFPRPMGEKMAEPVVEGPGAGESTEWGKLAEKVMGVAEEVCGLKQKSVENPWMVGREEELAEMRRRMSAAMVRRYEAVRGGDAEEVEEARRVVVELRSKSKRTRRS